MCVKWRPGAEPRAFGITLAPRGTRAWASLIGGIVSPRSLKRARIPSRASRSRMSRRRNTVAITLRVMSSDVGPRPPVAITTSARWTAVRNASPRRSGSSPTVVWYEGQSPASARSPEIMSRFVFGTSPWRSSLPIVMTSAIMIAPPEGRAVMPPATRARGSGARGSRRAPRARRRSRSRTLPAAPASAPPEVVSRYRRSERARIPPPA